MATLGNLAMCNKCYLQNVQFGILAIYNTCNLQHIDGPVGQTLWTDQFSILEALASSHIQRLILQFVHCCSFRVQRRPCSVWKSIVAEFKLYGSGWVYLGVARESKNISITLVHNFCAPQLSLKAFLYNFWSQLVFIACFLATFD